MLRKKISNKRLLHFRVIAPLVKIMRLFCMNSARWLTVLLLIISSVSSTDDDTDGGTAVISEVEVVPAIVSDDSSIPPIFVMNLKRSQDRWEQAQRQMAGEGLIVERLDAIDGRALSNEELRNQSTRMAMYLQPRGVIGCYLSHRKFWQMVVDEGHESAIIFEDDVKLVPDFKEKLKAHLALFGNEVYDVVLLGEKKLYPFFIFWIVLWTTHFCWGKDN